MHKAIFVVGNYKHTHSFVEKDKFQQLIDEWHAFLLNQNIKDFYVDHDDEKEEAHYYFECNGMSEIETRQIILPFFNSFIKKIHAKHLNVHSTINKPLPRSFSNMINDLITTKDKIKQIY